MWNGKLKAVTFSYDDGVMQDKRLVEIFNKYGMKATFNLNSGMMYNECIWNTNGVDVIRMSHDECLETFEGHEVASHTLTHPDLVSESEIMIERQIAGDKANLEKLFNTRINGMAYPGGSGTNDLIVHILRKFGLRYARLPYESGSFDIPSDFLRLVGTVRHANPKLFEYAEDFIKLETKVPKLFYIWGHSYEFDINNDWEKIDKLCAMLSGCNDIFFGTNDEVLSPFYIK